MRLLWVSNAPHASTGYGQQTALWLPYLAAEHEVAHTAIYGHNGAPYTWHGIPVFGGGYDGASNDVIPADAHQWGADWTVILFDAWTLKNPLFRRMNTAVWCPVDHLPAPDGVVDFFRHNNAVPIAMSQFGRDQLVVAGLDPLYVPHGIDTSVFRPTAEWAGKPVREHFGIPAEAFVVGMNAANKGVRPSRKAFPEHLLAFRAFCDIEPNALLWLHTYADGSGFGMQLRNLINKIGIDPERVRFTDQYRYQRNMIDPDELAAMYSSWDVLLACSMGEGFGIPVIEAQACETPVVVSNFSAQPELVADGFAVGGVPFWNDQFGAWWQLPDIEQMVEALVRVRDRGGERSDVGRKFVVDGYDADVVWERHWRPALAELEGRLPDMAAVQPERVAS